MQELTQKRVDNLLEKLPTNTTEELDFSEIHWSLKVKDEEVFPC